MAKDIDDKLGRGLKKIIAWGAIIMALSGFLGGAAGTQIPKETNLTPPARILVVDNCGNKLERQDVTNELKSILTRVAKKQTTVEMSLIEIFNLLPLKQISGKLVEEVKAIVTNVSVIGNDESIQEGVGAIADVFERAAEPLPTPLPQPSAFVEPKR